MHMVSQWLVVSALLGASAQDFEQAVSTAVAPAEVLLGGTAPGAPIVTQGNHLDALLDGTTEVIDAAVGIIERTEHVLLLQIYEWEDGDESTQHVARAIAARVARALTEAGPLQVRLLVDDSWPALSAKHREKLELYVMSLKAQPLQAHGVYVELAYYPGRGFGILHSKTIVRDGVEALVMTGNFKTAGGLSADYYNMGVLLSGPVTRVLQDDWLSARYASGLKVSAGAEALELGVDKDPWTGDKGGIAAATLSRRGNAKLRNQGDANPQDRALIAMLRTARHRVTVLNPALNVARIMDAIVEAVLHNDVHIDMVLSLNMDRRNQAIFAGADNSEAIYRLYKRILKEGGTAAASRLQVRWASLDGVTAAPDGNAGNVHAKAAGYDDNALWVGSMNWDWQSWNNSREVSVALFGAGVARDFNERIFAARFEMAAPLRAADLPRVHRRRGNGVYEYLLGCAAAKR